MKFLIRIIWAFKGKKFFFFLQLLMVDILIRGLKVMLNFEMSGKLKRKAA